MKRKEKTEPLRKLQMIWSDSVLADKMTWLQIKHRRLLNTHIKWQKIF